MKTTHDVLNEFYAKAKKIEKELKINRLLNRTSDLTQLNSIYSILFPSSCKTFYRWYCDNKFERGILDEIYDDQEEIPVSGESYKKAVKLYDEHLKALKEYYIENYSDEAYSDNNSMQKDLNEICTKSQDEYEKKDKISLHLNYQVKNRFYAWLHDNSESFWCCIILLLGFCTISCFFIFNDNIKNDDIKEDKTLKQYQDKIEREFYKEVKDDKDFTELFQKTIYK